MGGRVFERTPYFKNNVYTCPILMIVQGWLFWRKWRFSEHDGWRLLKSPHVIDHCRFPVWLIKLEQKFWYGYMGLLIAKRQGFTGRWVAVKKAGN